MAHPRSVCIYGWQHVNGDIIQPLYCGHADWYADYSHGVRLVQTTVLLNGAEARHADVLRHPDLSTLLSDEGPIASPRIPEPRRHDNDRAYHR